MRYRIFATGSGIAPEAQQLLEQENCILETGDPKDNSEEIAQKLKLFDPEGLIVRQGKITGAVMDAAESLKIICKHGVGIDNIDVEAATERGIPVMYTPQANYESAAEHTLALILALLRKIPHQDKNIREGIFDKKRYDGLELFGKTIGLIGFGRIGRRLAELVAPFSVKVLVYHPSHTAEPLPAYISKVQNVEAIFSEADIISLHCPLVPDTKVMINKQSIAQMKQNVFIINTARGGLVNEQDLIEALQKKWVRGAALDVFAVEPLKANNPLLALDNIIVTAHVGGASDNSLRNMGVASVSNVLAVLKGEPIDRSALVNQEVAVASLQTKGAKK